MISLAMHRSGQAVSRKPARHARRQQGLAHGTCGESWLDASSSVATRPEATTRVPEGDDPRTGRAGKDVAESFAGATIGLGGRPSSPSQRRQKTSDQLHRCEFRVLFSGQTGDCPTKIWASDSLVSKQESGFENTARLVRAQTSRAKCSAWS